MSSVRWPDLADQFPFHLAVVAEEISPDFEHVLVVAQELGVEAVEFGELWGDPLGFACQEKLDRAKNLLERYEIGVCGISPTTFKSVLLGHVPVAHIQDEPHFQEEMSRLKRQLAAAKFFGAPLVRVYSCRREAMVGLGNPSPRLRRGGPFPEEMQEKVAQVLTFACRAAEEAEIVLGLENVRSCWGNSGYNTSLIVERVNSPWLKIIWDQSNGFVSGEDDAYPTGYEAVKPYVAHVQIKDAVVEDRASGLTRWECIGNGELNIDAQLRALKDDGYTQYVSIETHWSPPGGNPEANTRHSYAGLMELLSKVCS